MQAKMTLKKCGELFFSHSILKRCIPDVKEAMTVAIQHFQKISWLEYAFSDVANSWKQIVGMCIMSIGVVLFSKYKLYNSEFDGATSRQNVHVSVIQVFFVP